MANPPTPLRHFFRFGVPPSLGGAARERGVRLVELLTRALGKQAEVSVAESYDELARDLLTGKLDAAWAPPFVCARVEAMGIRILVRGVRRGASTYRAALVARKGSGLTLEGLSGRKAAWVDRDSVGGYLLSMAQLRAAGHEPQRLFASQAFTGSYASALAEVLEGRADVTSVFAPPDGAEGPVLAGLEEISPGASGRVEVVALSEEAPNDGVAVAMSTPPSVTQALESALLSLPEAPEGPELLRDVFSLERFEAAPRLGYRALYRVALASL